MLLILSRIVITMRGPRGAETSIFLHGALIRTELLPSEVALTFALHLNERS